MNAESAPENEAETSASADDIVWTGDYPVVKNKTVAISIVVVWTISCGAVGLLLVGLAVHDGNYDFVTTLLKIVGGIWLAFTVLSFLIGQFFFGGKVPVEVIVGGRGVTQIQRSRRAAAANQAAIIGGLLAGGARGSTAAGAGLLAASRQVEAFEYADLREAKANPKTGEIRLWDDWHTVMQLFVPPDRFEAVLNRIETGIAKAASRRERRTDVPVAVKVLVWLGATVFGTFLLAGFPLAFSPVFVLPMVALTCVGIVSKPPVRGWLGWALAIGIAGSVVLLFKTKPPSLHEPGSGLVLGIQLAALGLFALFGVCAGLGVFDINEQSAPETK